MGRTSVEWWNEVKRSPARLEEWLRKQYHGEITAAERIAAYCLARLAPGDPWRVPLGIIASQERKHAAWVAGLLAARGLTPEVLPAKPERYWTQALGTIRSFQDAAAVAHHAERMRLERIRVIARDRDAPADIRDVFQRILRDELFHARTFQEMAGPEAIDRVRPAHLRGAAAIGFVTRAEAI